MSWQAHQAVLYNSKQTKLFRLMSYLAEHSNENLIIDPAPNQETIALFFNTTTRTVRSWISKLISENELKQIRVGSGPGKPSAYQIILEIPQNLPPKGGKNREFQESKVEENTVILSAFDKLKAEVKAEISALKAEILELKAEKVEAKGGKGGRKRRKALSTESADDPYIDPSFDPKENIYISFANTPKNIDDLITALNKTTKTRFHEGTLSEFTEAAYALDEVAITPEDVTAVGELWKTHCWYDIPSPMALKTAVETVVQYKRGQWPQIKKANGTAADALAQYESMRSEILS